MNTDTRDDALLRPAETPRPLNDSRLMTPGEVAAVFRVDPRTVTRWGISSPPKLESTVTPGGHHRYYRAQVEALAGSEPLMLPAEIAALFRVDPRTVARWSKSSPPRIRPVFTLGGHYRFRRADVEAMLGSGTVEVAA